MESGERYQSGDAPWPAAEAIDPVIEVFKKDVDETLLDRNLRLSTEERAQQLVNAARFIRKFRPLVTGSSQ